MSVDGPGDEGQEIAEVAFVMAEDRTMATISIEAVGGEFLTNQEIRRILEEMARQITDCDGVFSSDDLEPEMMN